MFTTIEFHPNYVVHEAIVGKPFRLLGINNQGLVTTSHSKNRSATVFDLVQGLEGGSGRHRGGAAGLGGSSPCSCGRAGGKHLPEKPGADGAGTLPAGSVGGVKCPPTCERAGRTSQTQASVSIREDKGKMQHCGV